MQTDYALRTLLYLAHAGEQVSVDSVARGYGISKEHLFKVVQQLVRLGYVQSRAGRNGGIRLVRDAGQINVASVVGEFEGRVGVLPCVSDQTACNLEPGCVLRSALIKAEQAFYDVLARMTIADIVAANAAKKSGGVYNLNIVRSVKASSQPPTGAPS